jgi:tetratricopeptide (TPR) repeat protein
LVGTEEQLFRANGVNVDLELALFDADHGKPQEALTTARAEWGRRHSVHVADALGWALYRNGRYEEAAGYARQALHLGTRSALFLFHAGMIQAKLDNTAGAISFLKQSAAANPNFSILESNTASQELAALEKRAA